MDMDKKTLCKNLEHYETPEWAVESVLDVEILTERVVDPCAGTGVLGRVADRRGYKTVSLDLHDWGFGARTPCDYLDPDVYTREMVRDATVLMNPPFSKAEDFVRQSIILGAKKIVCFCPISFWTSIKRKQLFDECPPASIHVLSERATCWRHDIPPGLRKGTTRALYAWFVWRLPFFRADGGGTEITRLYKSGDSLS